ncbi:unnamed protein product [Alternaria alternata]
METDPAKPEFASSLYKHQELRQDQIRLLTTKCIDGSVEIEIDQYTLTEDLDYDAISYVWGSAPALVTVNCNDRPLVVTSTALEMLHYLHRHQTNTTTRKIWIDAICINQEDEEEKGTQIPLMREIYSRARAVVVWMGLSTPETDIFFTEFQEMRVKLKTWKAKYDADPDCPDPDMEERPHNGDAFWGGLSRLLGNEWFRRLWTYQEIILPGTATLLCGDLWADFNEFVDFLVDGRFDSTHFSKVSTIGFGTSDTLALRTCQSINFYRKLNRRKGGAKEIHAHNVGAELNKLRERCVKEPIDRVWAIVGLLQRNLRSTLSSWVDYSAQGRDEYWKTWIMFAKALMNEPLGMSLLYAPPTREPKPPHLPSWCPNLSGRSVCSMEIEGRWNWPMDEQSSYIRWALFEQNDGEKLSAGWKAIVGHDKKLISTVMHDNMLRVRGFVVDTIEEVVEHENPLDVAFEDYDVKSEEHMALYDVAVDSHLRSLELARRVFYRKSECVTDIPEDFIMSIFLDWRINERAKDTYREVLPELATWYSNASGWGYTGSRYEQLQCGAQLRNIRGLTFFSTKGSRIGYAYPGCRPGDQIAVFYGGESLYILRDLDNKSDEDDATRWAPDHVQYLGAAFIPHLMEQHQRDAAHIGPDTTLQPTNCKDTEHRIEDGRRRHCNTDIEREFQYSKDARRRETTSRALLIYLETKKGEKYKITSFNHSLPQPIQNSHSTLTQLLPVSQSSSHPRSKAKQLSDTEWETLKPLLHTLYIKENRTLAATRKALLERHGLNLSQKQLTKRFHDWSFKKNVKQHETEAYLLEAEALRGEEEASINGVRITAAKYERWEKRARIDEERKRTHIKNVGEAFDTPSSVTCSDRLSCTPSTDFPRASRHEKSSDILMVSPSMPPEDQVNPITRCGSAKDRLSPSLAVSLTEAPNPGFTPSALLMGSSESLGSPSNAHVNIGTVQEPEKHFMLPIPLQSPDRDIDIVTRLFSALKMNHIDIPLHTPPTQAVAEVFTPANDTICPQDLETCSHDGRLMPWAGKQSTPQRTASPGSVEVTRYHDEETHQQGTIVSVSYQCGSRKRAATGALKYPSVDVIFSSSRVVELDSFSLEVYPFPQGQGRQLEIQPTATEYES